MQALIDPKNYYMKAIFCEETSKIFTNNWVFACMQDDLDSASHFGLQVGVKDLVIQLDSNDRPKAFINSCSHRGSLLCEEGRHKGKVRCPYHGWVYDKEGIPVGIPCKENFPEVIQNPTNFKLKEVACSAVGKFIFICLGSPTQSLAEYLGLEYTFLENISAGMNSIYLEFKKPIKANWKVVIENSLEGYHVPVVHQETFLVADGMSKSSPDIVNHFDCEFHSSMINKANKNWLSNFENRFSRKIGNWPYRCDFYTHHHIFPNLTITTFLGYSFHIQNFLPIDSDITKVHSRTYGTSFENQSDIGKKIIEKIYEDSKEFTLKVFDEDIDICEKVQRGLHSAEHHLILGDEIENRINHFQKAYQVFMK